jgi:2-polyprenyl-3-methyl-5-hydroxy-6-metoxy-1,4-benzoquinol methylase
MRRGKSEDGTGLIASEPSMLIRQFYNLAKKGKVLDLYSGEGRDAVFLAEHGFEVITLNHSQENLEKAIRLAEKNGVSVDFRNTEPLDFKMHKSRYSLIIANGIFQRIRKSDLQRFAPEIIRGLKKGGILIGSTLSVDDPLSREFRKKHVPEIEENCFAPPVNSIYSFFDKREVLNLFPDMQVLQYAETDVYDSGRWRGLVEFVFRKN